MLVSVEVPSFFWSVLQLLELYSPCSLILLISFPLSRFPLFFKPLSLWPRTFAFSNFPDCRVGLSWVISTVLSRLELFLVSLSLVRYIFLLLPLCTFTCSRVRGSLVVVVYPFFPTFLAVILPFYRSSAFPYTYSIMQTSSGPSRPSSLRIGGSSTKGSDLG